MRRFELGGSDDSKRLPWLGSVALHGTAIVLAMTVAWQARFRARPEEPPRAVREWVVLPPVPAPRSAWQAAPPPGATQVRLKDPVAVVPPQMRVPEPIIPMVQTPTKMEHYRGPVVVGPQLGDGRPWVSPRPALPAAMAEALYGNKDTLPLDEQVKRRLHAMLDTLNKAIDAEQRSRRRPTWGTEIAGLPFSIDSQYINIAGIKVPTVALALLGQYLPAGNYEGALEQREFETMRRDLVMAAERTGTFREFQKYVRELRERKQAERDSARARTQPPAPPAPPPPAPPGDTSRVIP